MTASDRTRRRPPSSPGWRSAIRAVGRLCCAGVIACSATACGTAGGHASGHAATSGTEGASRFAPYVDMTLGPGPDLAQAAAGGVKVLNLAFVTAASGSCRPTWGGARPYDATSIAGRIREVRLAGGDVRVSFGGARSLELAQACASVADLAAAYQTVIDAHDLTLVDFDVEGAALEDRDSVRRRNQALAELQASAQRRGRSLRVSYTLPAGEAGLTTPGQDLLRNAQEAGVEVETVNVMTMNFGTRPADLAARSMTVAEGAEQFVRGLWPRDPAGDAWGMMAVTLMIGVNDTSPEVFRLQDAMRILHFAEQHRLAWLSFWSLNRDRPCPAGTSTRTANPLCSGVQQRAGDFTTIFARYA